MTTARELGNIVSETTNHAALTVQRVATPLMRRRERHAGRLRPGAPQNWGRQDDMAQTIAHGRRTVKPEGNGSSHRATPTEVTKTETAEAIQDATRPENVVMFTSFDGTVREVGDLPPNLGRATALANEKSVSKVWGTPEEEAACHDMRKGI